VNMGTPIKSLAQSVSRSQNRQRSAHAKAPVFIVGCPRSGTTLLYHMLLSAGGFAVYRTESHVFSMIVPRFGDLSRLSNRKRLMDHWLWSDYHRLSGLQAEAIRARVLQECCNGGDFLRIVMESIARGQNVNRWAENTPEHILNLAEIKKTIPDALVIHIIRDGRDAALSLEKEGWIRPFAWDKQRNAMIAGLYWEWLVGIGRKLGRTLSSDYMEVSFEDLHRDPQATLAKIGEFIDHNLDYDHIQQVGIGSISQPNTSFGKGSGDVRFNPVGRWRSAFSKEELARFEGLVGRGLKSVGYELATPDTELCTGDKMKRLRALYRLRFASRQWLKSHTPLGRFFVHIQGMEKESKAPSIPPQSTRAQISELKATTFVSEESRNSDDREERHMSTFNKAD
jgi:hypothetical protein